MKKIILNSVIALFLIVLGSSCSKEQREEIDCALELLNLDIHHQENDANPLLLTFDVEYTGNKVLLDEIIWDYGDGVVETLSGVDASHTYTEPGDYKVTATVTIQDRDELCILELEENVTAVEL